MYSYHGDEGLIIKPENYSVKGEEGLIVERQGNPKKFMSKNTTKNPKDIIPLILSPVTRITPFF